MTHLNQLVMNMIHFLQKLKMVCDPEQVEKLDFDNLSHLSYHLHWKDRNGLYIGCNERTALDAGFKKERDFLGNTDFSFLSEKEAAKISANDKLVIAKDAPQFFIEHITLYDGKAATAISHKAPLRLRSKKILGTFSFSFILEKDQSLLFSANLDEEYTNSSFSEFLVLNSKTPYDCKINKKDLSKKEFQNINRSCNFSSLSKRELDCVRCLLLGKTMRETGEELFISPRTVETHLDNVKSKLGCHKKTDLMAMLFKNGFAQAILSRSVS